MLDIKKLKHTQDSSSAIMQILSSQAVSALTLYGKETHSSYRILREGICYNSHSEKSETFGFWKVYKNISMGTGQILLTNGDWVHKSTGTDEKNYSFVSVEDALSTLFEASGETLSAIGDSQSILKALMETDGLTLDTFGDDFTTIGWHIYSEQSDFSAMETDITIAPLPSDELGITVNLQAHFDWETKKLSFVLGDNQGDGFNDHLYIQVNAFDNKPFSEVIRDAFLEQVILCDTNTIDILSRFASKDDIMKSVLELAERADTLQQYFKATYKE